MRLLLSVFLFLAVPAFAAVQPYQPQRVGNTFSFPKSAPTTTYRDLGTARTAFEMGQNRTRYLTHDARMAFERSGITIDAKLKTGITKDMLKNGFKSAFKKGAFTPAGLAKAALVDTLGQALIDGGLQWIEDQQTYLKQDESGSFRPNDTFLCYEYCSGINASGNTVIVWGEYPKTITSSGGSQVRIEFTKATQPNTSNSRLWRFDYIRTQLNISNPVPLKSFIHVLSNGSVEYSQGFSTLDDSKLDSIYDDYVDLMPLDAILKMADAADMPTPDFPDSVTIPQDQMSQLSQPREISRETDPETGKEKIKTEQEKIDAQVTNNNQVIYNSTTITKTFLDGAQTATETKDNEPPPTDPGTDYPEIPDFELPKEKSPDFSVSLPTIPTSFSCVNPNFQLSIMTSSLSFPLPLCEWIEHFRGLFEWFWSVMTAIVIYLMARNVNLRTGESR